MNVDFFKSKNNLVTTPTSGGRNFYRQRPKFSGDQFITKVVNYGDSMYSLAQTYLRDEGKWNMLDDFIPPYKDFLLPVGLEIDVPFLIIEQKSNVVKVL